MIEYKTLMFQPDSPTHLDSWLYYQYTQFGLVLVAVYGEWFIFRVAGLNEL